MTFETEPIICVSMAHTERNQGIDQGLEIAKLLPDGDVKNDLVLRLAKVWIGAFDAVYKPIK